MPNQIIPSQAVPIWTPRDFQQTIDDAAEEQWLPVIGFESLYEVSDYGRVRSLARRVPHRRHGTVSVRSRIMATVKTESREQLNLWRDNKMHLRGVHRLVLEAFVGPCPEGMEGCHNDGNPHNNHVSNLRWDTSSANRFDAVRHGTHNMASKTHCKRGHEFSPENTVRQSSAAGGGRACRKCKKMYESTDTDVSAADQADFRADMSYLRSLADSLFEYAPPADLMRIAAFDGDNA